jgi:hypothetical protein
VTELSWFEVAWPGKWGAIKKARVRYFALRAARLLRDGDFIAAELSLLSSLQLDPANYEATLFLGHLKQYQQNFPASDAVFRGLLDQHPHRRQETAIAWHDALLVRQRYRELAVLALHMAAIPDPEAPFWVRSALFALRASPNVTGFVDLNANRIATLPSAARALFLAEGAFQQAPREAMVGRLLEASAGNLAPVLVDEFVDLLLRLNEVGRAEALLRRQGVGLTAFDRAFAQMRIDQASGDAALVRLDFEALLRRRLTPASLDRLVAWLIEHPDRQSFARLERAVSRRENQPAVTGAEMWVVALACGATAEAAAWARICEQRFGLWLPSIAALNFSSDRLTDLTSVPHLVVTAKLPREVIFSLLRRMAAAKRTSDGEPRRP